jgi:hypothetical protein
MLTFHVSWQTLGAAVLVAAVANMSMSFQLPGLLPLSLSGLLIISSAAVQSEKGLQLQWCTHSNITGWVWRKGARVPGWL